MTFRYLFSKLYCMFEIIYSKMKDVLIFILLIFSVINQI